MKALLVMTDQSKAAELSKLCASKGISCQLADGGFYALTMLERDKPDAIISNRDVLDMSGLDFYDIVRSDESLNQSAFILLDEHASGILIEENDLVLNSSSPSIDIVTAVINLHEEAKAAVNPAASTLPKSISMPKTPQISGTLEVLTLFDLIMSLNQNQHSGKLYLRVDDNEATVVLIKGNIVHSEILNLIGEPALVRIFTDSEDSQDTEFYFERLEEAQLAGYNSISAPSKELLFKVAVELDHMREQVS